ncbi:hypothetical protein GCM10020000_57720 [Streptomyces olivoverticillatus]
MDFAVMDIPTGRRYRPIPLARTRAHPVGMTPQTTPRALTDNPFTLGVASGDPLPDSVVLWTRLAPLPYEVGNGLPADGAVDVQWELASDESFRQVVQRGTVPAPRR